MAGQLYHVIARGNERRRIFIEDEDYGDFLIRLESGLKKTGGKALAWCLMPNHFHLLILRGQRPLAELMRRVMTGYVVNFNARHKRVGHLFQGRYKAILCEAEEYLLELVAYIHLNPLRANIVGDLQGLKKCKWCGHGGLAGNRTDKILDKNYILSRFSSKEREAVRKYELFVADRARVYRGRELSGGGLKRSMGGLSNVLALRRSGERDMYDDRVLGGGDFVEAVLKEIDDKPEVRMMLEDIKKEVGAKSGISFEKISSCSREHRISAARALYCYLAREKAGVSGTLLMKELKISSSGVSRLVVRGERINANK